MNLNDLIAQVVAGQQAKETEYIEQEYTLQEFLKVSKFGNIDTDDLLQDTAKNGSIKYFVISQSTQNLLKEGKKEIAEKERIYLGKSAADMLDSGTTLENLLSNNRVRCKISSPVNNTEFVRYQLYLAKDGGTFSVVKKFNSAKKE